MLLPPFPETEAASWARIVTMVEGPAVSGEEVEFHLHDSFGPQLERRAFHRWEARLDLTAWGGFTVGVWLPDRRMELELDLALLEDAPRIVRDL